MIDDLDYYSSQSRFTDPGGMGPWLDAVPVDLAAIRGVSSQSVFHYWANGDVREHGFSKDRMTEINLRYAEDMLERLHQLNPAPPTSERKAAERVLGCCRDHTVLFVTMARRHGIPARVRVGFATYFVAGWYVDHVIAEVWDAAQARWRLMEPQVDDGHVDPSDETVLDVHDVPRDRFVVGPQAWAACRSGAADPERFVVAPGLDVPFLRSWSYLAHNLVLDLAALAKHEMLLWDGWGLIDTVEPPDEAARGRLDSLAARLQEPSLDTIAAEFADEALRVPPVVRCSSPLDGSSVQVTLR